MIDCGTVKPGSTLRIPFSTFNSDGAAITMTNFAAADILIYKDGSTTERGSTSGYTATTDFDGKTGKHLIVIDLADNTTADFFGAGSEYLVALDAVTVDTQTTGGWFARFKIGYTDAIHDTTIATLAGQTSFTLTAGPADDSALVGCVALIHDAASAIQRAIGLVSAYTGSTKTVTLVADPAIFTMAAKDNISFFWPGNTKWFAQLVTAALPLTPTTAGRTLDVSTTGEAGVDWANVGSPTTTLNLSGTTIGTVTLVNTLTTYTGNTPQTGDSYAIVNSGTHGNAAIKGYVDDIGVAGAGLTAADDAILTAIAALNNIAAADVWAAATRTLTAGTNIQLPSNGLANVVSWTVAITGNITGNLSGSVGTVTGAINTATGVITTLDALDTAQDTQHGTTQTAVAAVAADLPGRPTRAVQLDDVMFMMVDATDLNTPETGVTVAATISKDGGAFASCSNSVSEVSGGWYKLTLTATEMTANSIALKFTGTGCAQRNIAFRTQPT
jgi:hypothetical protein